MPCRANVSRMVDMSSASLRRTGCEHETESAIVESSLPCCLKVSGDGDPCYGKVLPSAYRKISWYGASQELTCFAPLNMSTSKLFARRSLGGTRGLSRGRPSAERALLRDCCTITEPVREGSTADSQLRIDDERSLDFNTEFMGKLCVNRS